MTAEKHTEEQNTNPEVLEHMESKNSGESTADDAKPKSKKRPKKGRKEKARLSELEAEIFRTEGQVSEAVRGI